MSNVKTKDGKIELMRFLACLMIMSDHMGTLGLKNLERPFRGTWVYVEFFLILSGFFTAKHFINRTSGENKIENSVKYTINKFKRFMPYTIVAVLIFYIVLYGDLITTMYFEKILEKFGDMPFEMFLLSAAGTNGTKLYTIWFFSATFLMTPFICMICQIKNKYIKLLLVFYPAVFYYLYRSHSIGSHDYPNQLIRAFCGMALGVLVFLLTEYLNSLSLSKNWKILFTILTLLCYALLLFIGWRSLQPISVDLICFIIIVTLTFSKHTYLPSCSYKPLLYLGKLSMPMFIWHPVMATIIVQSQSIGDDQVALKVCVYYLSTLIISALSMLIFSRAPRKAA